jgi:hypothetical protein
MRSGEHKRDGFHGYLGSCSLTRWILRRLVPQCAASSFVVVIVAAPPAAASHRTINEIR